MLTVRTLITNALDEARLCPRSQPASADLVVSALTLLQNRVAEYSNTNYLSFQRQKTVVDFSEKKTLTIGDIEVLMPYRDVIAIAQDTEEQSDWDTTKTYFVIDLQDFMKNSDGYWETSTAYSMSQVFGDDYSIPDVYVPRIQNIVRVYHHDVPQKHIAWEDYNLYTERESYTDRPVSDQLIEVTVSKKSTYTIYYNEKYSLTLDSTLRIPVQFQTLFQSALVYDLARQFPRLSDSTVNLLQQRLSQLEKNVQKSSAVSKFITRDKTPYSLGFRGVI